MMFPLRLCAMALSCVWSGESIYGPRKTPGGYEVDFLARYADGREQLVQVCANLDDARILARELRALAEAGSARGAERGRPDAGRRMAAGAAGFPMTIVSGTEDCVV